MSKRFMVLDSWRGLAAMTVALSRLDTKGAIASSPLVQNSYLFVDFFFVLSGFVIAHAYGASVTDGRSFAAFAVRRFGRLWPLHAFMLALFVAYEALRALAPGANGAFPPFTGLRAPTTILPELSFLTTLGLGPTAWNDPSWSISAEFWTYMLFGAICISFRKAYAPVAVLIAVVAMGFVVASSTSGMDVTFTFGLARCIAGFLIGTLAYSIWLAGVSDAAESASKREGLMTAVEVVGVAGALTFVWTADRSILSFAAPLVFGFLVLLFAMEGGALSRLLRLRPFQFLGELSYSIYMVALFVALVFGRAIQGLGDKFGSHILSDDGAMSATHALLADLTSLAYVSAVVGVSFLTFRLIETPGRQLFNSLSRSIATLGRRGDEPARSLVAGE